MSQLACYTYTVTTTYTVSVTRTVVTVQVPCTDKGIKIASVFATLGVVLLFLPYLQKRK